MRPKPDHTAAPGHLPYLPALDGVRALALLGVLGFHAGFGWLRGGYLPLTAFFVLSGFLITSILLLEHQSDGRIDRGAFWVRRARRLVPAAILGVALAAWSVWATGADLPRFKGDALSSLVWLTNWRFVASGQSYGDLFADPSPLQHYWSLAIEEQFYLVLPLLAGALLLRPGRSRWGRWPFTVGVAVLAVASVVTMRLLHQPGDEPLRTYYGTDTRAVELLIGVLLATAMIGRDGLRRISGVGRVAVEVGGLAGLAGSVALWCVVTQYDDWLFEGGLAAVALLAAAVVLAASQTGTVVSRLLGSRPLAALGRISYGAYLYHWPLFLWLTPERTGLSQVPLFGVRMTATVVLASLSYRFVEQPIRHGRLPRPVAPLAWVNGAVATMALVAIVVAGLPTTPEVTLLAEGAVAAPPPPAPTETVASLPADGAVPPAGTAASTTAAPVPTPVPAATVPRAGRSAATTSRQTASQAEPTSSSAPSAPAVAPAPAPAGSPTPATTAPTTAPPAPPPPPARVMVLGDSLAQNLAVGLQRRAKRTGDMVVWNRGVAGCPLSRHGSRWGQGSPAAECSWWGLPEAREEIDEFVPSVVLVVAGINDLFDRQREEWGDAYIGPRDPRFDAWLLSEYQAVADVVGKGGVPVVWVPPPCLNWDGWARHVGADHDGEGRRLHHNRTTIPGLRSSRPVQIGDLEGQLCPGGRYDPNALGIKGSRPDGIHLTDQAAEVLADRWLAPLLLQARR